MFLGHLLETARMLYLEFQDIIYKKILATHQKGQLDNILNTSLIIERVDKDKRIIEVNENFCQLFGHTRDEVIGQKYDFLNSGLHSSLFFDGLWETVMGKRRWSGEIQNKTKDGHYRWTDTDIFPILNPEGEITEFLIIRKDITEQKYLQDRKVKDSRLKAIGETTSQIIHDVMNPLTVVLSSTKFALKKIEKGEEIDLQPVVTQVLKSATQIEQIFKQMRESLITKYSVERLSLSSVLQESVETLSPLCQKHSIKLNLIIDSNFQVVGNKIQLIRVVNNLIKNSVDALSEQKEGERWIEVKLSHENSLEIITITDSGQGIDPHIKDKIWDSLFSTKLEKGGTGLGLRACRKIIQAHKGSIELNSDSANTQFIIKLTSTSSSKAAA
jgi:PAS domain S-box-containing protein